MTAMRAAEPPPIPADELEALAAEAADDAEAEAILGPTPMAGGRTQIGNDPAMAAAAADLTRRRLARYEATLRLAGVDETTIRTAARPWEADLPPSPWLEPEDRGAASLSALGETEYVENLIRPGRIVVVAAEEGSGKSFTWTGELGIRIAVAGGAFAETWLVRQSGPVLVLSEMHADDDYAREATILDALGFDRAALVGRYYRLPLMTAAGSQPALRVAEWREWITTWLRERAALLLIVDTATGATQVDPWGRDIQAVYRDLRAMLETYPELAVILVVHVKKPTGRGERRISDVLGEWGRWCDVVVVQERDGPTRTKLATYKRVRHERRIVATKRDGLLVEPIDLDETKATKVPLERVVEAIAAEPGIGQKALAKLLDVSPSTAAKYAEAAESEGLVTRVDMGRGKGFRLYPAEKGLDPLPSNGPTPSNVRTGPPLDGGSEGSNRGTVQPSTHPIRVDGPSIGPPPSASIACRDYSAHQSSHHRTAAGWACGECSPEAAA